MLSVGIAGDNARAMAGLFKQGCRVAARVSDINAERGGAKVHILIAQDASPALARAIAALTPDDYLVCNADKKEIFPFLRGSAARLITYGFNAKACVTASSVADGALQACIQRGFVAWDGRMREPQELRAASLPAVLEADAALGVVAALAVCGAL